VQVHTPTRESKADLQAVRVATADGLVGLDLTEHAGHDYVEVVLHSLAQQEALQAAGFTWDVRIADLDARAAQNREADRLYAASVARSPLPSGRDHYRKLANYRRNMAKLAKNHPNLVRRIALDLRSIEGRKIRGIEIGKDIRGRMDGRPVFVMLGLHHAREWPSGENTMEFGFDLVRKYGKSDRITRLLRHARVIIIPVVNVDGFRASVNDGLADPTGSGPTNEYKRKNCRMVDGQTQPPGPCDASKSPEGEGIGVDLNRNYGAFWGGPGAAAEPSDPTYRGASRFSEPETRAVRRLIRERHVTTLITNHTFSNLILRPNGVNPQTIGPDGLPIGDAPDERAMRILGRNMAEQNGYSNQHGWELYDTTGTTEDWSYNATGGYGYTFEIGSVEFHPPYEEMMKEYLGRGRYQGKGNREAYLLALENAVNAKHHSIIGGTAPAGANLRLIRRGLTPKWNGTFRDPVNVRMRVGRDGTYTWHVNPSTRPVVDKSRYQVLGRAMAKETYQDITPPNMTTDKEYTVTKDADLLDINLDWPTPDDLDLTVYKRVNGEFKKIGESAGFVGEKERVMVKRPRKGQVYRMRVTNFASGSPQWTLTAALHTTTDHYKEALFELWTMRCERKGTVRQTKHVYVERGGRVKANFNNC
jgi:murein tripeptide amidase MpaA